MMFGTGVETNERRIQTRLKQIQCGKNTIGYDNYLAMVPKSERVKYSAIHPRTPDPYEESSKRQFDRKFKAWRRELHKWEKLEDIAEVEIQVQVVGGRGNGGAGSSGTAMDGVTTTGTAPLVVMAPLSTPHSRVVQMVGKKKQKGGSSISGSASVGEEGLVVDSSVPAGKRMRLGEVTTAPEPAGQLAEGEADNDYGRDLHPGPDWQDDAACLDYEDVL